MSDTVFRRKNPKVALTATEIASIKPPADPRARIVVRDPGCPGLALRVMGTGSRSWSLEIKIEGRQRRFLVGDAASLSLKEARDAALALRHTLRNEQRDPIADRRAEQAERKRKVEAEKLGLGDGETLAGLLDNFATLKAGPAGIASWPSMRKMIEGNFADNLAKAPAEVTRAVARGVLDRAVARGAPISGKRAVRYLSRVLSWAVARDALAANPLAGMQLDELTKAEKSRDRVLTDDELRAVWKAAEVAGTPFGDLARLYLLTGLRRDEAALMRWSDLDGDVLVLAATKTGTTHRLPLSGSAISIVRAQRRKANRPYVFLNRAGAALDANTNWHRVRISLHAASGTKGWSWHDLRRTARTLLARCGVDDLVAELILNHALPGKLRKTYNLHRYQDEMRTALERLAALIDDILRGKGNVVALPVADEPAARVRAG